MRVPDRPAKYIKDVPAGNSPPINDGLSVEYLLIAEYAEGMTSKIHRGSMAAGGKEVSDQFDFLPEEQGKWH